MGWSEERVETLKKLWLEGHSASQIAKHLGGVTRNAVIGKVARLKLSSLGGAVRQEASAPRKLNPAPLSHPKPRPISVPVEAQAPDVVGNLALKPRPAAPPILASQPMPVLRLVETKLEPVPIYELPSNGCRYPVDEREGVHFFCGTPKGQGKPNYCADHHAICFTPAKPRPIQPFYERPRYERPIRSASEL